MELDIQTLRVATSVLMKRLGLGLGQRFGGKRDYDEVFGYEQKLTYAQIEYKYSRQDVAARAIDAPPLATWGNPPKFKNAEMQTAWDTLNKRHNLWGRIQRADSLARMNEFSMLILGTNKGRLNTELKGDELRYVKCVGAGYVTAIKLDEDQTSERFGLPKEYTIDFSENVKKGVSGIEGNAHTRSVSTQEIKVHHSRVIHIVETTLEDDVYGRPLMVRIFNLLDDLKKIVGGAAETYWMTANRGMQVDLDKEMDLSPEDAKALTDEIDDYIHGVTRFVRTRGVEMKNLGSNPVSSMQIFDMLIGLLSGTTGIPKRILLGAEAGQLASEQDRANWAERLGERRVLYAEPKILRPFAERLQSVNLLPEGEIEIEWPSAFILSPLESSMVAAQNARAIANISKQTGSKTPMQVTTRKEAREMIHLEGDLPESELMVTEGEDDETDETRDPDEPMLPSESDEPEEN